ncbi:MAG TPA: hypothetical protein VMK12_23655 [Anaeromyxobacteraceae bacterium]|nr:hypothetical protein [Anaeromyxobacteraceae bacterium]
METLRRMIIALRSKDWNEFAAPAGSTLDPAFTVCDKVAGQSCPVWPASR